MQKRAIPSTIQAILSHKASGPLIRHWVNLSENGSLASRKQLDPIEFWTALPDISIHVYDETINDYGIELAGDNISDLDPLDFKGLTLQESYKTESPEVANSIIEKWNAARANKHCLVTYRDLEQAGASKSSIRCILPLSNPEAILCFMIYGYDAEHAHQNRARSADDYRHEIYDIQTLKKRMAEISPTNIT